MSARDAYCCLEALAARVEAADNTDAEALLRETFGALFGWLPRDMPCGEMPEGALPREARFEQLLRARAYLDAALTLVPEGWDRIEFGRYVEPPGRFWADIQGDESVQSHDCATPALALCAAALRARQQ